MITDAEDLPGPIAIMGPPDKPGDDERRGFNNERFREEKYRWPS
jgi:hypothetical protein